MPSSEEHRGRALETLQPCEAAQVPMYVRLPSQLQSGLVTSALAAGTCLHIGLDDISSMCLVAQSCLTLCDPMDCSPPGSSVHEESPGKNTGVGCHALLQGNLPNPGIEPRSPTLQVDSLLPEPPGKSKNTGVGSLPFHQGIFPTQEPNRGLLLCMQILYQLSYQ